MRPLPHAWTSLGLLVAAALWAPRAVPGFVLTGASLDLSQRDVRVFDNFADPQANDDTAGHPQLPGFTGAERAIWKGFLEWGSTLHGDGSGDPTQPLDLGSGGANFDTTWQGAADSVGGPGDNVASALATCGPGLVAFVETPPGGGWRMRFCDDHVWSDGPGLPVPGELDLQATTTRLAGSLLGLGSSSVSGAVMSAIPGGPVRDLHPDDQAGIQAVYGPASAAKPRIVAAVLASGVVSLQGTSFSPSGNEVWFTSASPSAAGLDPVVRVTGVPSTGGGTTIQVPLPTGAGAGDVLVRANAPGSASLSNAFPLDVPSPGPPSITAISPATIEALVPGTAYSVSIQGTGFVPTATVEVNGMPLVGTPTPFTVVNPFQILFDMPQVGTLGPATVTVRQGSFADSASIDVVVPSGPRLQVGSGDPGQPVVQGPPLEVIAAGTPGHVLLVVHSRSSAPSDLPGVVHLDLGAGFTDVPLAGVFVVEPKAWTSTTFTLAGVAPLTSLFAQGVDLSVFPFAETNLQEIFVVF